VERTSDEMRQHESEIGLLTGACPSVSVRSLRI
jgi:hypothetical protein